METLTPEIDQLLAAIEEAYHQRLEERKTRIHYTAAREIALLTEVQATSAMRARA